MLENLSCVVKSYIEKASIVAVLVTACYIQSPKEALLTLSQTANFRLSQTEKVCRRQF